MGPSHCATSKAAHKAAAKAVTRNAVFEDCVALVCSHTVLSYCVNRGFPVTLGQTLCCICCVATANPNTVFNTVNHPIKSRTNTRKTVR